MPAVIGVVQVAGSVVAGSHQPQARPLDALGVFLLVLGPAALLLQRRWPVGVLVVTSPPTAAYFALGYPVGPAVRGDRRRGRAAHRVIGQPARVYAAGHWAPTSSLAASWLRGAAVPRPGRRHRGVAPGSARRVERFRFRRERILESRQARAEQAKRQASEERLRIARELHDVLAHHVSLINVQAGIALHLMDEQPEQARGALTAIKSSSKEVLVELRAMLGVLRRVDDELPRAARRPGWTGSTSWSTGCGRRDAGRRSSGSASRPTAARRGRRRVPDRPGGADQRRPARRVGARGGAAGLPVRGAPWWSRSATTGEAARTG